MEGPSLWRSIITIYIINLPSLSLIIIIAGGPKLILVSSLGVTSSMVSVKNSVGSKAILSSMIASLTKHFVVSSGCKIIVDGILSGAKSEKIGFKDQ